MTKINKINFRCIIACAFDYWKNMKNIKILLMFMLVVCVKIPLEAEASGSSNCEKKMSFIDQRYFIKDGYKVRENYIQFDDSVNEDGCQDEVYLTAASLAIKNPCKTVADIGCGSGFKLVKYFSRSFFKTIGFDVEPNLSFVRNKYPERTWYFSDLKTYKGLPRFDIVICSDVVEHFRDPDDLLNWINNLDFNYLVISTPDRDLISTVQKTTQSFNGPPEHKYHIREWNFIEFEKYISQYFNVVEHFHTQREWWGQLIIATKK